MQMRQGKVSIEPAMSQVLLPIQAVVAVVSSQRTARSSSLSCLATLPPHDLFRRSCDILLND